MRPIDLAIAAGRKRQSPQTGFIHHQDTIPLFENFCFALALFRSRLSDNVLEGRAFLEKLLPFQVGGNFPLFLHEFPNCTDDWSGKRIRAPLAWIFEEFANILGPELKDKVQKSLLALSPLPQSTKVPRTARGWADYLLWNPNKVEEAAHLWHPDLLIFMGEQQQDRGEPEVTLLDLFMGQYFGSYSQRALKDDRTHLLAALIPALAQGAPKQLPTHYFENGLYLFWGDGKRVHSLCSPQITDPSFEVTLCAELKEEDPFEVSLFLDYHEDHQILVNGRRANTFQEGDRVEIISKEKRIEFSFEKKEGEGIFFGHILRGNRPRQIAETRFEAYDWQISLRTVRRSSSCKLSFSLLSASAPLSSLCVYTLQSENCRV